MLMFHAIVLLFKHCCWFEVLCLIFTNFGSWCVFLFPTIELRYLTIYMPYSLKVDVGRRQRAHARRFTLARCNKFNSASFILLTDDGKRTSVRNFVFEPNEMMGNVQHMCHTIIMKTFWHYIWVIHAFKAIHLPITFEFLTAVTMWSSIFWDIWPCSPVEVNRSLEGTHRHHLHGRRLSQAKYVR